MRAHRCSVANEILENATFLLAHCKIFTSWYVAFVATCVTVCCFLALEKHAQSIEAQCAKEKVGEIIYLSRTNSVLRLRNVCTKC